MASAALKIEDAWQFINSEAKDGEARFVRGRGGEEGFAFWRDGNWRSGLSCGYGTETLNFEPIEFQSSPLRLSSPPRPVIDQVRDAVTNAVDIARVRSQFAKAAPEKASESMIKAGLTAMVDEVFSSERRAERFK